MTWPTTCCCNARTHRGWYSVDQRSHDYLGTLGLLHQGRRVQQAPVDHELLQPLLLRCGVGMDVPLRGRHRGRRNTTRIQTHHPATHSGLQDGIPHRTKTHHAGQGISSVGYGRISSEWQYKEDGRISYTATVPPTLQPHSICP